MLRRIGLPTLLLLGLLLLAWSAVAWVTGGVSYHGTWIRVSSRDPLRPFLAGLIGLLLVTRWAGIARVGEEAERISATLARLSPFGSAIAALLVGWLGVTYGTYAASGSDPYGYISQADLWASGRLSLDFTSLAPLPWGNSEWTLSPLGYRPGLDPYTIVPTYAPGLPMLMAASALLFGQSAVFLVVPACAALAVWLTYVLGRQLYDPLAGLMAAFLLATSPAFLYQTMWPMSDVPVTMFWILAAVSANRTTVCTPALSGLAAAAAVIIRPNLVPLAIVPAILIAGRTASPGYRALVRPLGLYVAALLPGPVLVAVLNWYWYGAPLKSGYGSFDSLYALAHFWPNARLYAGWLLETQSPFVLLAVLPFLSQRWRSETGLLRELHVRAAIVVFTALLLVSYFFYLVFEAWWYLRFLLPAFPLMLILASGGLASRLRRIHAGAEVVMLLVAIPLIAWMAQVGASRGIFSLRDFEQRYVRVAGDIADMIPDSAVVISMQHSGSLRYYADRLTLRYDYLPPRGLDRAVEALVDRGMHPYLLLERWEEPGFIARFAEWNCRGDLRWQAVRQWQDSTTISLYDLTRPDCRKRRR
jgi:hypothetical protein